MLATEPQDLKPYSEHLCLPLSTPSAPEISNTSSNRNLFMLSATDVIDLINSGSISVEEYARSLLNRIQDRDPIVRAWVHLDPSHVIEQAKKLDRVPFDKRGPLHGVAVGIKDVALTKDAPTRYYSAIHEHDGPAAADAAAVAIFRAAGALILGKTATTEFAATSVGGPCTNPHNVNHTPGGSSSGSAAAVADFQVPITLGTQTGGSIIRPGSFNGIYAFKPTWGLVSTEGLGRFSITCDTPGFYARTLEDLELLSRVFRIIEEPVGIQPKIVQGSRIGFIKTAQWPAAGPGTRAAWEKAQSVLSTFGAIIEDVQLPPIFEHCQKWRDDIVSAEAKFSFLPRYLQYKDQLHPSLIKVVEKTYSPSREALLEAYDGIARLRCLWDDIVQQYDAVITPSVVDEAPEGLEYTGDSCFCSMWTVLHIPVINIPGFHGESGLPIGLSILGGRYGDMKILKAGASIYANLTSGS